jgi:hypothetical protein
VYTSDAAWTLTYLMQGFFVYSFHERSPIFCLLPVVLCAGDQERVFDDPVRRYVKNLEVYLGLSNAPFGSTSKRSLAAWYLSSFDIVGMARIVRYASRGDYDVPKV